MAITDDSSIDAILKSIREAIIDKEQRKYFEQFMPENPARKEPVFEEDEIFELTKNMIVKREDIPYQLGVWNFDDVAKKILKKYKTYFSKRIVKDDVSNSNDNQHGRVRVKEDNLA